MPKRRTGSKSRPSESKTTTKTRDGRTRDRDTAGDTRGPEQQSDREAPRSSEVDGAQQNAISGARSRRVGEGPARFPVVGIGASAGGLAALEEFLAHVPPDSGMAFVIVTHQAPGRAMLLPDLLAKRTDLAVIIAEDRMRLEPNRVYVAPPASYVEVSDETLHVAPMGEAERIPHLPIDHLFRSLARSEGEHAIGIVLSGNGSDGTVGINEIKAASGVAMAQDPTSAQFTGMPMTAIGSGLIDYVLRPQRMPEQLLSYVRARSHGRAPGRLSAPEQPDEPAVDNGPASIRKILAVLRHRTGSDFQAYKKSTVARRIERRMHVHNLPDAAEYARFLDRNAYEVDALFKELLISVTRFFRDPAAFESLERELSRLIEERPNGSTLRAWITGCATGEEAYSVAIIVREALERTGKDLRVQIFATDLDQRAVDVARHGRYADGIAADVGPERLEHFFTREDSGYRVNKDLRELIVFAVQNLIKDPPFTKLDLLTCRNLLIYLEPALQKRVLSLFSYSVRPGGLLLLGTSESLSGFESRFDALDKRWKLFRRRESAQQVLPDFPRSDAPGMAHLEPATPTAREADRPPNDAGGGARAGAEAAGIAALAERVLLSNFVPPSIVISERGELVFVHGRVGQFLEPAAGEPSTNAFHMAREGLRLELPAIVRQASGAQVPVVRRGLQVRTNGGFSSVAINARRLIEPEALRGALLISFELEPPSLPDAEPPRTHEAREQGAALEEELRRTRENLQGTIEELETSNEELKSTNEELQSTNEELQSANEELETSREEMQSLNEELQAVNAELEERNRALSQANDDMQNLLNSTNIATVFLDERLTIKRFTTQAKKVFNLIDTDIGRPISDLAANLRYEGLLEDARQVLHTLAFREREIQTTEGAWRLMRIMPYRTHDNLIDGLVLTFVDIDDLKRTERIAQEARAYAETVIECVDRALVVLDADLQVVSANHVFYRLFRADEKDVVGLTLDRVFDGGDTGLAAVSARVRRFIAEQHEHMDAMKLNARLPRGDGVRHVLISAKRMPVRGPSAPHLVITIDEAP